MNSEFKNEIPEEFLMQLKKVLGADPQSFGKNAVKPVEPLAVITHGDFLRNNIAFKYKNDVCIK